MMTCMSWVQPDCQISSGRKVTNHTYRSFRRYISEGVEPWFDALRNVTPERPIRVVGDLSAGRDLAVRLHPAHARHHSKGRVGFVMKRSFGVLGVLGCALFAIAWQPLVRT